MWHEPFSFLFLVVWSDCRTRTMSQHPLRSLVEPMNSATCTELWNLDFIWLGQSLLLSCGILPVLPKYKQQSHRNNRLTVSLFPDQYKNGLKYGILSGVLFPAVLLQEEVGRQARTVSDEPSLTSLMDKHRSAEKPLILIRDPELYCTVP